MFQRDRPRHRQRRPGSPAGDGFSYPVTLLTGGPWTRRPDGRRLRPRRGRDRGRDEAEALAEANDSAYGIAVSVFTSTERGEELAQRIDASQVAVNGLVKTDPRRPTRGTKRSGSGGELGLHGIHEFVSPRQVWVGPARMR